MNWTNYNRRHAVALVSIALLGACMVGPDGEHDLLADGTDEADRASERVGTAQAALSEVASEDLVSTSAVPNLNVRAAWIKSEESSATQTSGSGLLAWTRIVDPHPRAAWSSATNWNGSSPTWVTNLSNDTSTAVPPLRWPAPDNLCEVFPDSYECTGASTDTAWADDGHYDHVAEALWTGLDGVAAIVTTCGKGNLVDDDDSDLCIATSIDSGAHFTHTQILSVASEVPSDTGFNIDPDSVHASLAYFGEQTNGNAGDVGLPIYVIWRNVPEFGDPGWWFTRVVIGVSGQVAESMPPQSLGSNLPDGGEFFAGNHASIFGYRHGQRERIAIAYSDPELLKDRPNCDSSDYNTTEEMAWYVIQSNDLGLSWGCFTGIYDDTCLDSDHDRTLIAEDREFRPCVGSTRTLGSGAVVKSRNNDRPEVAVNSPALSNDVDDYAFSQFFFFAVNQDSSHAQRVSVYRTGGNSLLGSDTEDNIKLVAVSGTPTGVTDSWSQSIDVVQHADSDTMSDDDMPVVMLVWRNAYSAGMRMKGLTFQSYYDSTTITTTAFDVTHDVSNTSAVVPFPFTDDLGLYTAIAHHQGCSVPASGMFNCPTGFLFNFPNEGFFAAWPDTRDTSYNYADIYASGFTY